VKFQISSF